MVQITRGPGVVGWDVAKQAPKGVVSPTAHRLGLSGLALAEGVFRIPGSTAALTTSNTGMTVVLAPAVVAIAAPRGGWYFPSWQSPVTLPLSPAGSQDRIDLVVVEQQDYEMSGSQVDSAAELMVLTGTPSATPSPPQTDTDQLVLWNIRVPAAVTSTSQCVATRTHLWTGPAGSVLGVQSKEQLSELSVLEGQIVRDDSTGWEWRKTKTGWKLWTAQGIKPEQTRDWYPVDRFRLDVSSGIAVCNFMTHRATGTFTLAPWIDDHLFAVPRDVAPNQECNFWTKNPFPNGLDVFVRLDETGMFNLQVRNNTTITDGAFIIVSGATWPVAGD